MRSVKLLCLSLVEPGKEGCEVKDHMNLIIFLILCLVLRFQCFPKYFCGDLKGMFARLFSFPCSFAFTLVRKLYF